MSPFALFAVALGALRRNALRSFLAMLGIIIAVGSVIVMVSIGGGAKQAVEQTIQNLGSNMVLVSPGSGFGPRAGGAGSAPPLTDRDLMALRQVPGLEAAAGFVRGNAQMVAGGVNWSAQVFGISDGYLDVRDWPLLEGRDFTATELRSGAKVVVLGTTVVAKLFGEGTSPIGQSLRIKDIPFTVVGVLESKGQSSFGSDQDDVAMVPVTTARRRLFGRASSVPDRLDTLMVKAERAEAIPTLVADLTDAMRARRQARPGEADDFSVRDMTEFIRARTETQTTLGLLLGATAAISLVVGGIGIMNIMLVSVTERTREIGIRMAVGARRSDVLTQFLVEAVALCMTGGLIGVLLGVGGTYAIAEAGAGVAARGGTLPIIIEPSVVAAALASSALVGVFFGFWPARRAARLNPIDALRYE